MTDLNGRLVKAFYCAGSTAQARETFGDITLEYRDNDMPGAWIVVRKNGWEVERFNTAQIESIIWMEPFK